MLVISEQVLKPLHISWCTNTPMRAWDIEASMGSGEHGWLSFLRSHLNMQSCMQAYHTIEVTMGS